MRRRPKHAAKWDRCVRDVRKGGSAANAFAVCTKALGAGAFLKHGRRPNPLSERGPYELTLIWREASGKENTVFKRFTGADEARRAAKRLVIALNRRTNHPVRWNVRKRIPFNP